MAPLPHNNTAIFYVDYTVDAIQHTFEVRFDGAESPASFGSTLNAFLNTIAPVLYQLSIDVIRFQAEGSNVSAPVVTGIEGNTYGTAAPIGWVRANFIRFVGRSSGGRRVSFDLYVPDVTDTNFRITAAENSDVADAIDILNGEESMFLAIDGLAPTWYAYVNIKQNSYWARKLRGS